MTRPERRNEKKKYEKDLAAFCRITRQYFPDFVQWLQDVKDPRKISVMTSSMQTVRIIMR